MPTRRRGSSFTGRLPNFRCWSASTCWSNFAGRSPSPKITNAAAQLPRCPIAAVAAGLSSIPTVNFPRGTEGGNGKMRSISKGNRNLRGALCRVAGKYGSTALAQFKQTKNRLREPQ